MLFFRATTENTVTDCSDQLKNLFAGPKPSTCVIVGASPHIEQLEGIQEFANSRVPKMGMNYAGIGKDDRLLIPLDFWTAFDPTSRFHKGVFLNPTTMKFVRSGRHKDIIPGTQSKVCDAPNTFFCDVDYSDYQNIVKNDKPYLTHGLDSMIQALDIVYNLGFRRIVFVGCGCRIMPSQDQIEYATSLGVKYENGRTFRTNKDTKNEFWSDLLSDFFEEIVDQVVRNSFGKATPSKNELDTIKKEQIALLESAYRESQYSFNETKSFRAAISSDTHYFERVQYLRLSQKTFGLKGVQLMTADTDGRMTELYEHFPYISLHDVVKEYNTIYSDISTVGRYSGGVVDKVIPHTKDLQPYGWDKEPKNLPKPPADKAATKQAQLKTKGEAVRWKEVIPGPKNVEELGNNKIVIEEVC
jgi:hypothetical protein